MIRTRDKLLGAYGRVKPYIHHTPLIYSHSFSTMTGAEVHIKAENLQKTGSFKVRGVFSKMLGLSTDRVITASMGNHAQAVAFAAQSLGVGARIVMPVTVPIVKEQATKGYGADVVLYGENLQESLDYALAQEGYTFIHPFDDEEVIAGQATLGVEITEDLDNIDAVLVPVGGGGLIAGIALALKEFSPDTKVIGIQTESATSAYQSFHNHTITAVPPCHTQADGIAVGKVGTLSFEVMCTFVDDVILVKEETIALAVLLFLERKKILVEGAGATPLAALLANQGRFKGKRVVLVASGGNIDLTLIDRIVQKGLIVSERIVVFEVIVEDVPGSLHGLTRIMAGHRANILDVSHKRLTRDLPVGKTLVTFTVEVRSRESLDKMFSTMSSSGFVIKNAYAPCHTHEG